jgi:type I restriction enzyme, S subunit
MKSKWKNVHLTDVLEFIQNGLNCEQSEEPIGYPISRIETIQNARFDKNRVKFTKIDSAVFEKYHYKLGDIAFSHINSFEKVGKVALYNGELPNLIHGVNLLRFRFKPEIFPKFAFYYFNSTICRKLYEPNINRAINQASINQRNLCQINFPVPPLPQQYRIVAKLDSLFERIDKAIALVEQNIANAQHLMASVLNDLLDGLDCDQVKLQDACIINPLKSEIKDLGNIEVSFLPMADLNAHQIDFTPKHTNQISEVYTGYTYFKNGDVLLAKVTPCFENGKAGLADNLVNGIGFGSSEYYVLRAKQSILPAYIYYNLTSSEFLRKGAQNMSGAVGLKRVTKDFLFNYEIPIPNIELQESVVKYLALQTNKLSVMKDKLEKRQMELKTLKSSLLNAAFKGEL